MRERKKSYRTKFSPMSIITGRSIINERSIISKRSIINDRSIIIKRSIITGRSIINERSIISKRSIITLTSIITHVAGQTYVWHGYKWSFAGSQIYLQPAKIKSQHFGVSLKFLIWNWKSCIWRLNVCQIFSFQVCLHRTTSVRNIRISDCVHT